jgi:transcriptional antiterminator RfaH
MYWGIATTKASRENTAAENLQRQGYKIFLPKYIQRVGKEVRVRVFFPRYIFILIEDQWHSINSTFGVSRLILNETKPARVPDEVIQDIRSREVKGLISLSEPDKFKIGENVILADGPMASYTAIYNGKIRDSERVRILIDLLGRKVSLEVDEGTLTAVAV